jgi:hypothetical protein
LILVACNLILGFLITPHYGQSTDEAPNVIFARDTLLSYQHPETPYVDVMREDKGPFYLMVWLRAGEFLDRVVRGWAFVDGRHFVNFLAFQMAIVSVYVLALRFVPPAAALAGTLLFETQPVFFGHAFVNQKDTPFMAFFALTVVLGLGMADRFIGRGHNRRSETGSDGAEPSIIGPGLRAAWAEDPRRARRAAILMAALALSCPCSAWLSMGPGNAVEGVDGGDRGEAWAPINRLFIRLAEHAAQVPVEDYISRATLFTNLAIFLASAGMVCVALAVVGRVWPKGARAGRSDLAANLRQGVLSPFPLITFPAAIVFGMSIAIRTTALYAGLLVAGYALVRAGPRIAVLIMVYFGWRRSSPMLSGPSSGYRLWGWSFPAWIGLFNSRCSARSSWTESSTNRISSRFGTFPRSWSSSSLCPRPPSCSAAWSCLSAWLGDEIYWL